MHVNRCCNSWGEKCDQEISWEDFKNKVLIIEIQRTWNVKPKLPPVITVATGTISKSLRQYLGNKPGRHEIKELHK
jgi:hypothetical protein